MGPVGSTLSFVLLVFLIFLVFRLIMEYVFLLARSFQPKGLVAMALELTYSVTDPPLKALRRVLPPLRIGQITLDLGFIVLFLLLSQVLMPVARRLPF
ncbi:MAG: YggT family protein [Frankiales bacterium]|nr:YggT family protein [Frankiales bacterium]